MSTRHDELRDELVAILGASRELPAQADAQLADLFLRYLGREEERGGIKPVPVETPHQPHYSLMMAGGAWGAALMFLFLLLVLDGPSFGAFLLATVLVLAGAAALTRAFLFMARHNWQVHRLRVTVQPAQARPRGRK